MPGFDRTGPWGAGPMTGSRRERRISGNVDGKWFGGRSDFGHGMGCGIRRGLNMRRGLGHSSLAPACNDIPHSSVQQMGRDQKRDFLRSQVRTIKEHIEFIEAKISELEQQEN